MIKQKLSERLNIIKVFSLVLGILLFAGCIIERPIYTQDPNIEAIHSELETLAKLCGLPDYKIENKKAIELVSEIKKILYNNEKYYGKTLTKKEKEEVEIFLTHKKDSFEVINEYDIFIRRIQGKKIIIIPENEY